MPPAAILRKRLIPHSIRENSDTSHAQPLLSGHSSRILEAKKRAADLRKKEDAAKHAAQLVLEGLREHCTALNLDPSATEPCLRTIWAAAFPTEPFCAQSPRWKLVGFQGLDPLTDLRGAGIMGLRHFADFIVDAGTSPDIFPGEGGLNAFPWSIASINCTGMLQTYLRLNPALALSFAGSRRIECSTRALGQFVRLGTRDSAATPLEEAVAACAACLGRAHAVLLRHLAATWRHLRAEEPELTILDFPRALLASHELLQRAVDGLAARASPWRLDDLKQALDKADASDGPACADTLDGLRGGCAPGSLLAYAWVALLSAFGCVHVACCGVEGRRDPDHVEGKGY